MDEKLKTIFWGCYLHVIDIDNRLNPTEMMTKYERMRIAVELASTQLLAAKDESTQPA